MTISDDLPREYHERDIQEDRESNLALLSFTARTEIFADFSAERQRQIAKWGWGQQTHPDGTGGRGTDVRRDMYRALCDARAQAGRLAWQDILLEEVFEALAEEDWKALEHELVQVGAVVTNWLEDLRAR